MPRSLEDIYRMSLNIPYPTIHSAAQSQSYQPQDHTAPQAELKLHEKAAQEGEENKMQSKSSTLLHLESIHTAWSWEFRRETLPNFHNPNPGSKFAESLSKSSSESLQCILCLFISSPPYLLVLSL